MIDFCQNPEEKEFYDNIEFQEAVTKQNLCTVSRQKDGEETNDVSRLRTETDSGMGLKELIV